MNVNKVAAVGGIAGLRLLFGYLCCLNAFASGLLNAGQATISSAENLNYSHLKLIQDLLDTSNYDKRVLPIRVYGQSSVNIKIRLNLYQLLDVNEPNQYIRLYFWVTQMWEDEYLGWLPENYGGVNTTVLPYHSLWIPDTFLYNSLEMTREDSERWINLIVKTNTSVSPPVADVRFMYPAIFKFTCELDIQHFPFDKQNCTLVFGSWTFSMADINYWPESENILMESFVENEEWRVLSFKIHRREVSFNCCPETWVLLEAHLVIQRKPLYYMVNLVVPTAIITLVAVVGFFMPSSTSGERNEKVNLGITTLLAMSILLLMVSDNMPTTSNFIPVIGWFYLSIILLISLGTCVTSLIVCVQERGIYGQRVPPRTRTVFFRHLAPCLRMRPPRLLRDSWRSKGSCYQLDNLATIATSAELSALMASSSPAPARTDGGGGAAEAKRRGGGGGKGKTATSRRKDSMPLEERQLAVAEWKFLATILDRALLIIFTGCVLLVSGYMVVLGWLVQSASDVPSVQPL